MADVSVTIFDNGPIKIVGPVTLLDENDRPILFDETEPVWLCRCGQSKDKPYCDGTHDKCGFVHKASG